MWVSNQIHPCALSLVSPAKETSHRGLDPIVITNSTTLAPPPLLFGSYATSGPKSHSQSQHRD